MSLNPYEIRHVIHKNPELSAQEYETTQLLEKNIKELSQYYNESLKIYKPLQTGLIVEYAPLNSNEYLLFRADIDALNIQEETDVEFKSKNDFMHACGHDVHTAILYGFLVNILEKQIKKNILFLFQPAEESGGGAEKILKSGILEKFNIKNAFALHVTDEYPLGTVATTAGVMFASSMEIFIDFHGKASHLAFPQNSKNALNALRLFLDSIEKIPKDPMVPFVFGIGKVSAGRAINIVPDKANLEGSVRTTDSKKTLEYFQNLKDILKGIFQITGVDFSISQGSFYTEVLNDRELFNTFSHKLSEKFKFVDCGLKMTAEDFGFFSKKYKSLMCWLGTSKGEHFGLHTPKFLPPDEAIDLGVKLFETFLEE